MRSNQKVALVTGSTDGVGRYVAVALAAQGMRMLIHGRDRERALKLADEIRSSGGMADIYLADFASLSDVRELANGIRDSCDQIALLINNAGIGVEHLFFPPRRESVDGHELKFAVNYLAGFLLTRLLLPLVIGVPGARIVNVVSVGQQAIDFENVMLEKKYRAIRAYNQSKLAQVMFTFDLAQELVNSGVTANCVHPASLMNTKMVRRAGVPPMSSVAKGGAAILKLAAAPEMANTSGQYFEGLNPARADDQAYNAEARERLRLLSLHLVGLDR